MTSSLPRRPLLVALAAAPMLVAAHAHAQGALVNVEKRVFRMKEFRLESGMVLPDAAIAYETYGTLAPDGRNAVLLTHGYTSSQHMAGRAGANGAEGSWDGLVGPGKAIDTDRLFVVSSNMLGSSYGSTNPAQVNPKTGKPYGADFPAITLVDIVNAQKALLDSLGVKHLVAVSAPKGSGGEASVKALIDVLAKDPNWNGGNYYENGGITKVLTDMRVATLKRYGIDEQLAAQFPDKAAREAEIVRRAETWSKVFDGNSLVVLRRASVNFDAERDFARIKAKVLYVLSRTDKLFPPSIAPGVMEKLKAAGVSADYFEIDSDFGHSASGLDAAKWAPRLKAFMAGLDKRS